MSTNHLVDLPGVSCKQLARRSEQNAALKSASADTHAQASQKGTLWFTLCYQSLRRAGQGRLAAAHFSALSCLSLCARSPSARGSPGPPRGTPPTVVPPPAAPASSRSPSSEGGTARRGPPRHQPPPIKTRNSAAGSRLRRPIGAARTVFASGVRDLGGKGGGGNMGN